MSGERGYGKVTFDSPEALRERAETEFGRVVIAQVMPNVRIKSTLRELIEERAPRVRSIQSPKAEN